MELFLILERKHLTVQIVDNSHHKQQAAYLPSPIGHEFLVSRPTAIKILSYSSLAKKSKVIGSRSVKSYSTVAVKARRRPS